MRVEHERGSAGGDARRVASRTFVAALRRRLSAAPAVKAMNRPVRAMAGPVQSVATGLRQARAEMDARVQLRLDAAAESHRLVEARTVERRAAVWPALQRPVPMAGEQAPVEAARRAEAPTAPPARPGEPHAAARCDARGTPPPVTSPGLEAVLALVERVETLLRAGRPALAFTLGGRHGQRVQLERLGPGAVAIRLQGGTFGRAEAQQLAAALDERGLRLSRLEWLSGGRLL